MTVQTILDFLWTTAPLHYKESWDNVGFLLGRAGCHVEKVLLALDLTTPVVKEAVARDCQLIVTHHPAIFRGDKHITDADPLTEPELLCLENRISVISMHTNLDCAPGGVNDVLAELLGLQGVEALSDGTNPGLVRCGDVEPRSLPLFAAFVKERLDCAGLRYADGGKEVRRVAVGGGSCIELADLAIDAGCDTFVTGDVKYHQFLNLSARGLNVIDAGHYPTENPVMGMLRAKLQEAFPSLTLVMAAHRDCVIYL